jgi:hypothetical protein
MQIRNKNIALLLIIFCSLVFCNTVSAQNTSHTGRGNSKQDTLGTSCIAGMSGDIKISKSKLMAAGKITLSKCPPSTKIIHFQMLLTINGTTRSIYCESGVFNPAFMSLLRQISVGSHIIFEDVTVKPLNSKSYIIPGINVEIIDE